MSREELLMTESPEAGSAGVPPFAPSELVYLFGTYFAGRGAAPTAGPHLPDNKEIHLNRLVPQVLAAALLADEQAGVLRLEVRAKKALFGLRTVQALYATATAGVPPFPAGSWEVRLHALLGKTKGGEQEVEALVYRLVPESDSPMGEVVSQLLAGLNARGLLTVVDTKVLKVFHSKRFQLKSSTTDLAAAQPLDAVQRLLSQDQQQRAELHTLLLAKTRRGVERRQKQDTSIDAG